MLELTLVLLPVIGLTANVIVQISLFRFVKGMGLLASVFAGFFIGMCCVLVIELFRICAVHLPIMEDILSALTGVITYAALGYCYFHFINLGETARRIRLVRELAESVVGLSEAEILRRYGAEEVVSKRLERLLKNGQIVCKEDRYYIGKPLMLWISWMVLCMKWIMLGKKSEFD